MNGIKANLTTSRQQKLHTQHTSSWLYLHWEH